MCYFSTLLVPHSCSVSTFFCFTSLSGVVMKCCVYIRRKSNAGLVALQECCPKVPALLLSPHHLHSFVQSQYSFVFFNPFLLSHPFLSLLLIITPYRLCPSMASFLSSFHTCSLPQPFDFFFCPSFSIENWSPSNLRIIIPATSPGSLSLVQILSLSNPNKPETMSSPWWLWKTAHVRFIWNINICQLMRPHRNIMNRSRHIVLIFSDRAESLICERTFLLQRRRNVTWHTVLSLHEGIKGSL